MAFTGVTYYDGIGFLTHDKAGLKSAKELDLIREHTTIVKHYRDLQSIADYPVKVRKLCLLYTSRCV